MGALYLLLVFLSCAAASRLLINKCCPLDQQLRRDLEGCVAFPGGNLTSHNITAEKVSDLTARKISFPWWMGDNITVYRPDTLQPMDSLFQGQPEDAFVRYLAERPCDWQFTKYITTRRKDMYKLFRNGVLEVYVSDMGIEQRSVHLDPEEYCVDRVDNVNSTAPAGTFVFLTCPCKRVTCIKKCCWGTEMLLLEEQRKEINPMCENVNGKPSEPFTQNNTENGETFFPYLLLHNKIPVCGEGFSMVVLNSEQRGAHYKFTIFPNASALIENYGHGVPFPPENFCIENTMLSNKTIVQNVMFCHAITTNETRTVAGTLYGSMFVVGSVCLGLTLFVYSVLPDLRSTLNAWALMSHAAAMLVASIFLSIGQLKSHLYTNLCYTVAFMVQFFFLAAFFWLNVMCIDIAWAFSGLRSLQGSLVEQHRRKYLYYSLYAWGSPVVISIVTVVLEFGEYIPNTILKPNIGDVHCWFETKLATLAYFYGPVAILLIANLGLFVFTSYRILKVQRETAILKTSESGRHDGSAKEKKRFVLYLKLFCLMGVTWITEIISWVHEVNVIYYVTDIINLLRGVFIFIIFCCKPNVLRQLQEKLHEWGCPQTLIGKISIPNKNDVRKGSNCTQTTYLSNASPKIDAGRCTGMKTLAPPSNRTHLTVP